MESIHVGVNRFELKQRAYLVVGVLLKRAEPARGGVNRFLAAVVDPEVDLGLPEKTAADNRTIRLV